MGTLGEGELVRHSDLSDTLSTTTKKCQRERRPTGEIR